MGLETKSVILLWRTGQDENVNGLSFTAIDNFFIISRLIDLSAAQQVFKNGCYCVAWKHANVGLAYNSRFLSSVSTIFFRIDFLIK